jgi:hypothetical protein
MADAQHVRDLPLHILDRAETLCASGFTEHAVIAAQSACELSCEQVVHEYIRLRGVAYLQESLGELVSNYNVANHRTRNLYNALASDTIQQLSIWPQYTELVKLRNRIVHNGQSADLDTARRLIGVARELVTHLMSKPDLSASDMTWSAAILLPNANGTLPSAARRARRSQPATASCPTRVRLLRQRSRC